MEWGYSSRITPFLPKPRSFDRNLGFSFLGFVYLRGKINISTSYILKCKALDTLAAMGKKVKK